MKNRLVGNELGVERIVGKVSGGHDSGFDIPSTSERGERREGGKDMSVVKDEQCSKREGRGKKINFVKNHMVHDQ